MWSNRKILIHAALIALCVLCAIPNVSGSGKSAPLPDNSETDSPEQQTKTITGTVRDDTGEALGSVGVQVKGSQTGVVTDMEGNYSINVPDEDAILVFSYVGYKTQEVAVGNRSTADVILLNADLTLDELVVVGYGVQKKKLVTGATVQVSGSDLQKLNTASALTSMQSQAPGVNIVQNNGQPGAGFKINIRGLGTVGNFSPLYVIDGMAGGDINALNPSDIESIDVLKDAASAAIYGARAANGVILVTTRQGKSGKISVTYDGFYGVQNVYKMPALLDARQYMAIMDEINFNEGLAEYNWPSILGQYYEQAANGSWKGTNWIDEMRNKNAPTTNHSVNMTGGSDRSVFSMGLSYTGQEGTFGSTVASEYHRVTFRLNSNHVLWKNGDLKVLQVGENLLFSHIENNGIQTGNQYGNDISNALRAEPLMPLYNAKGDYFDYNDMKAMGLDRLDPMMSNPIALMEYERGYNKSKNYALNGALNLQLQPIKGLIIKTQFGYKLSASTFRSFQKPYVLSSTTSRNNSEVTQNMEAGWNWTWENTANYKFAPAERHHVDVLVGQSMEKWGMGEYLQARNINSLFDDFDHAYIDNTPEITTATVINGNPWGAGALVSFFGRINYDYDEKYMLSLIMRRDGSSNFARGRRWGTFPSVSAGWVASNESFMEGASDYLDFLKLRASWGQNGNCNISNFQYLSTISFDATAAYSFGNNVNAQQTGGYADKLSNPDISWETQEQLDLGLDARFFNARLNLTFDWYSRTTKDWLVQAPVLGAYGMGTSGAPYINGGDVKNSGIEIAANWKDRLESGLSYGVYVNYSRNRNKVTRIANSEGILHGFSHAFTQGVLEMYRAETGFPIGYFWGYKTDGIFQNQADIDAWKAAGNGILQPAPQPGDVKFTDLNRDGTIDRNDKTNLGDGHPDSRIGFGLNLGYKGFDFSITGYGAMEVQIAKNYRKFADSPKENYTTDVYRRWHGEGTSNLWPRLTSGSHANYMNFSQIFVEDADYLKIQNVTLGYDLKHVFPRIPFGQLRIYVQAQNLFTFTKYSGMDPEIGYTPTDNSGDHEWANGIDLGNYPNPRTYLLGLNVKF
ncbi:MAG: TonB-dependent receptor [Prevotellaceae bacterium]|jgi:TonB-linked SusC/RagA family outer membrane protein|nr:TonB-dependent receptor [Prevotellaceae bacterium]